MNKLVILLLIITFLAGCIGQNNTTPPSTPPTENTIPYENITPPPPSQNETPTPPNENVTPPSPPAPKTYDVDIRNFVFTLTITTIKVGDSVKWTNFDIVDHSATADDNSFDTGLLSRGQSKTITFNETGTYNYHCIPHPWMKAKIIVK